MPGTKHRASSQTKSTGAIAEFLKKYFVLRLNTVGIQWNEIAFKKYVWIVSEQNTNNNKNNEQSTDSSRKKE